MERLTDSAASSGESRLVLAYPRAAKEGKAIAVTLAEYQEKEERQVSVRYSSSALVVAERYADFGVTQRHLFWLNSDNGINSVSAWLPDTLWSPPYNISLAEPVMPGSKALAACSSIQTSGEETTDVRLYYGRQESSGKQEISPLFRQRPLTSSKALKPVTCASCLPASLTAGRLGGRT